jgi:hypothetical protein
MPDQVAKALDGKTSRSVALSLRGVKVPDGWNPRTSIHVFVNKPDATAATSPRDENFVFAFHLSPLDPEEPQNFGMDLAPALARTRWQPGQSLKVTFVVVPPKNVELPKDLKVPFEEVVISLPDR